MPYIGANVDESTKADWEEYVEESSHGSISELVRHSVRTEVRRSDDDSGSSSGGSSVDLDRVQERQMDILRAVSDLDDTVTEAVEEREETEYPEEIVDLGHDLASDLETVTEEEYSEIAEEAQHEMTRLAAEHLGEPAGHRAQAAFRYLEDNVPWIRSAPTHPDDYYRVEQ